MSFMNRLNARAFAILGVGKENNSAGLTFHKCKVKMCVHNSFYIVVLYPLQLL